MIRFRVKELMAEKEFRENRRITLAEVAEACGINRMTLSKIAGQRGYSTVTDNLDRLCKYFDCQISDLITYIPDLEEIGKSEKEIPKQ
ncbi:helix-turn-helix domain-containing protein [Chitinibacter tainanensis]|uniref:helix-turn-helix domain-containing protein n=1 Tax=Chitinibacter tainanensis TaxID=230667 RepID=UPI000490D4C4|nr:helix-turn-helix transcriptional regulator [Chitinibacter tainanensis]